MRRVWFAVVALAIVAGTGGQARGVNGRCARALPHAPSLPAPIVVTTRCGRFRIQPSGEVVYKGPRTSPVPRVASEYSPADLTWWGFQRHHVLIGRGMRLLWRSRGTFPGTHPGSVGGVVLGRRRLAFTYYFSFTKPPRLYVARYDGREHELAPGESPVGFLAGKLVTWRSDAKRLVLRGSGRAVVVAHAVEPQWDRAAGVVVFRTGRRVRAFDGHRMRELGDRYELGVRGTPVVEPLGRFFAIHDTRRLVVLGYRGRVVASAPLPKRHSPLDGVSSSVVSNTAGTAVAFTATHRASGTETVYMLRAGARRALGLFTTQADFRGCGYMASVAWHERWLLYSGASPRAALIDGTGRPAAVDLSGAIARLPGSGRDFFNIAWAPAP